MTLPHFTVSFLIRSANCSGGIPPGSEEIHWEEGLVRVGLGAPDIPAATSALKDRGVVFIDRGTVQPSDKGALTQVYLGGVTFELVVSK